MWRMHFRRKAVSKNLPGLFFKNGGPGWSASCMAKCPPVYGVDGGLQESKSDLTKLNSAAGGRMCSCELKTDSRNILRFMVNTRRKVK